MRISKTGPYIIYMVTFSTLCSLASQTVMALNAWSLGYSTHSIYTVSELINYLPQNVFYAALQIVAALLIVRTLSLWKLFFLSCVFTIVGVMIGGFSQQMMSMIGNMAFPVLLVAQLLPYVPAVMILALVGRRRVSSSKVPDDEINPEENGAEVIADNVGKCRGRLKSFYARYWYVLDIILIIVILSCGTLNDPSGLIRYVCGLLNQKQVLFAMTFGCVFLMLPVGLCFVLLVLRVMGSWPEHMRKGLRLSSLQVFFILGLILYLLSPLIPMRPSGASTYFRGFAKYVESNADIVAIRSWLGTLDPNDCVVYHISNPHEGTKSSNPKYLEQAEWPEPIARVKPRHVVLSLYDKSHPKVQLNWGSGLLGSWGLVIGPDSMPTPESDISRYGEYRQEIHNGAYIWYGIE